MSIHPVEIVDMAQHLNAYFTEDNFIFSPQSLALMLEESRGFHYGAANYLVAKSMLEGETVITEPQKHNIIFGNMPKEMVFPLPSIYNNIIYFNSGRYETDTQEDTYLSQTIKVFNYTNPINWFTKDDVPSGIQPPTHRHLTLLLKNFGHPIRPEKEKLI